MAKIKLKKLLSKRDEFNIVDRVIKALDVPLAVTDEEGMLLIGERIEDETVERCPIKVEENTIGWVIGKKDATSVAALLAYLGNNEMEKKKLAGETLDKYRELMLLYDLSEKIAASLDIDDIVRVVTEEAMRHIQCTYVSVTLLNEETKKLEVISEYDKEQPLNPLIAGNEVVYSVMLSGKAEIINDVLSDPRYNIIGNRVESMMYAPLVARNKTNGIITIGNTRKINYSAEDLKLFNTIAFHAAVAIENAKLYNILKETFFETLNTLAETIEKRDPYTGGHTRRVVDYSIAIGEAMELSKAEINKLKLAALMHDIGKIGISDDILLKTGKLTQEEFEKMKRHALLGSEILENIKQLREVIPGVRAHHERYDGRGYPDGLRGNDIPLIGRIIAVADSFDAMTSDRPYRKGMSFESAFEELRRNSGTQFDSNVVSSFLELFNEKGLLSEEIKQMHANDA